MSKSPKYNFVLWTDNCDEIAATVFTVEFRQAGLRMKVVNLTRRQTYGASGLALVPDLTLERALPLADRTSCLIMPCSLRVAQGLKNHPRLQEFFNLARSNRARFVIGSLNGTDLDDLDLFSLSREEVSVYPDSEDLVEFARKLTSSLATLQ